MDNAPQNTSAVFGWKALKDAEQRKQVFLKNPSRPKLFEQEVETPPITTLPERRLRFQK